MLQTALRDLQWRRRRFLIGVIGTALVFAMSLLLTGLAASFGLEADRFLRSVGADAWVVGAGTAGPMSSLALVDPAHLPAVVATPGVRQAAPILVVHETAPHGGTIEDVNVLGVVPGELGEPAVAEGRPARASGEVVVDQRLGPKVGEPVEIGGSTFTVVGRLRGASLYGGQHVAYVTLADAQRSFLGGAGLVSAILSLGQPASTPSGLALLDRAAVKDDLLRPLRGAQQSVDFVRVLLWIVAACIVASIVYLSALERTRDFAVLKAVGTSTPSLAGGLALQAVLLAVASAVLAAVLAWVLAPVFPMPVEIPLGAVLTLPLIAVAVGLVASLAGLRRAVRVPPAVAFGGP